MNQALLTKLQVKGGRTLAVLHAPPEFAWEQGPPPGEADVVVLFAADRAALEAALPRLPVKDGAIAWVAYPKLTSKLAGDLNRDLIHALVPSCGFEVVAAIAMDEDWSAVRMKKGK